MADLGASLLAGVLRGAVLTIRTRFTPAFSLPLDELLTAEGEAGPLVVALQPEVTLSRAGVPLLVAAPAGAPHPLAWLVAVVVVILGVGLVAWALS